MKLHDLKPTKGSTKDRHRVGRGKAAGQGTYAGRGIKGQGARGRSGKKAYFEGGQLPLVRRLPFKRGFTNPFRIEYQEINVGDIAAKFEAGASVSPEALVNAGLLRDAETPYVVLGQGELDKKLTIHAYRISKSAVEKLEKSGGSFSKLDLLLTGPAATVKKMRKEDVEKLREEKAAK
jgi:large subunit ribosomal protein L15